MCEKRSSSYLSGQSVDAKGGEAFGVLGTKHGHRSDDVGAAVLGQSLGDDFQRSGDVPVGQLTDAVDLVGLLLQVVADLHLDGAAAGHQERVDADVSGDVDGVLEVALHLVEDILGSPAEENGAGLGVLALLDEGEVLVTDLTDLEFVS